MHEPTGGHDLKRFGDVIPVSCTNRVKHDLSLDFNLRDDVRDVKFSFETADGFVVNINVHSFQTQLRPL